MTLPQRLPMPDWIEEGDPSLLVFLAGVAQGRLAIAREAGGFEWYVPEGQREALYSFETHSFLVKGKPGDADSGDVLGHLQVWPEAAHFIGVNSPAEMVRRHLGELEMLREHRPVRFAPGTNGAELVGTDFWCRVCRDIGTFAWPCQEILRMCKTYDIEVELLS